LINVNVIMMTVVSYLLKVVTVDLCLSSLFLDMV